MIAVVAFGRIPFRLIPVAILIAFSGVVRSQPVESKGGFGHFFTGPAWLGTGGLQDQLRHPDVLGPSLDWSSGGVMTGGEGAAKIRRLIIGGGGFGVLMPRMHADSGSARMVFGGGYFRIGVVMAEAERHFITINGGIGGGGLAMELRNRSKTQWMAFDEENPLPPGFKEEYALAYVLYDINAGIKYLAAIGRNEKRHSRAGFMIGLNIGTAIGIPVTDWTTDAVESSGAASPGNLVCPYVRITIGGGGFRDIEPEAQ